MSSGFPERAIQNITDLISEITHKIKENDAIVPFLQGLLKDLQGQVSIAFSREDYFKKWGLHYLPSLCMAHLLQLCSNFKDEGIQNYGSTLFQKVRKVTDKTFCGNKFKSKFFNKEDEKNIYAKFYDLIDLNDFYDISGGCIHGQCKVFLDNNTTKLVKDIRAGDIIQCPSFTQKTQKRSEISENSKKIAKVICVVKNRCFNNQQNFVRLGNLLITPWHPVRVEVNGRQKWEFPYNLGNQIVLDCDAVYSFVLGDGHTMNIEGIECITLAHHFNDSVAYHEYFGTHLILQDLQQLQGWNEGFIVLDSTSSIRHQKTNKVIKITQKNNSI